MYPHRLIQNSLLCLGETCCDKEGTTYVNFITKEMGNDVIVRSVKMGNTTDDDFTNSLVMHPFQQASMSIEYCFY